MEDEAKTCVACGHVHEGTDGVCLECGCEVGKKESVVEGEGEMAAE